MADEHKNLPEALLAFQAEAPKLLKDSTAKVKTKTGGDYTYKYVDLSDVIEAVGPLLVKHGLTWSTFPCVLDGGAPGLRYKLTHAASGDCESDVMPLLVQKADPQGMGSGITYARRYSLIAVLNLIADADDDGAQASQANGRSAQATAAPVQATERIASAKQRSLIFARASEAKMPASMLANVVLVSTGSEAREFDDEAHAERWLKMALDRLPAKHVDAILGNIKAEAVAA